MGSIRVAFSLDDLQSWDYDGLEKDMDFHDEDTKDTKWEMPMGETMHAVVTVTSFAHRWLSSRGFKGNLAQRARVQHQCGERRVLIDGATYYPDATLPRSDTGAGCTPAPRYVRLPPSAFLPPSLRLASSTHSHILALWQFNMLGQNLQENFTDFLILGDTAHFLPKYAAHKRQLEQARWLKNVKGLSS
ncbi:hypothetical protein FB451DRAFT_352410 [Mycena latifolia]|nr:hypothetical protein FB451DRAFT_352410 [Mycena latifolia]